MLPDKEREEERQYVLDLLEKEKNKHFTRRRSYVCKVRMKKNRVRRRRASNKVSRASRRANRR